MAFLFGFFAILFIIGKLLSEKSANDEHDKWAKRMKEETDLLFEKYTNMDLETEFKNVHSFLRNLNYLTEKYGHIFKQASEGFTNSPHPDRDWAAYFQLAEKGYIPRNSVLHYGFFELPRHFSDAGCNILLDELYKRVKKHVSPNMLCYVGDRNYSNWHLFNGHEKAGSPVIFRLKGMLVD